LTRRWLQERKRDYYWRLAKEEGYRSRAAYKLLQANQSYHFIKLGDIVVDLGAAPGGWLQAVRKLIGDRGYVLGVDTLPIEPFQLPNVETLVGDVADPKIIDDIRKKLPHPADAVLCDVSPSVSGVWEVDHARQIDLARASLKIAISILRLKGAFFTKVFQGDLLDEFVNEMKQYFHQVRIIRPKATKTKSAELYLLGLGFKAEKAA
jgi:23S rRNA (uridine2552-2'-O)-methyltransferase